MPDFDARQWSYRMVTEPEACAQYTTMYAEGAIGSLRRVGVKEHSLFICRCLTLTLYLGRVLCGSGCWWRHSSEFSR
jgi:hypothetical protein